ncbi:hypothetical protein [Caballeronia cordobensis]|uniref:hypothetical protein n=1 Tax=Caballeronia cordobensis TaxID=1353886 RepID=UPI0006AD8372|nr:hypothetical protein [Caballeronia cordobensis]
MKVTIVSYDAPPRGTDEQVRRFWFETEDGPSSPRRHSISLRTARVILESNPPDDALTKMLRAIVSTASADYDGLIGKIYTDNG